MDNFKLYNDLYGEETGDRILKWSASQVQNLCSEKMSVFRVGSNEFLIIAEENRKEILLSFARLIQNTILEQKEDKPKVIQPITFSIGIAWDKNMAESAGKLFRQARRAAFYAKGNGKNRIEIYEKSFEGQEQSREKGYEQVTPTIFALMAAVDAKDSFTFEHSENVSGYAMKLAAKMGLPKDDIQTAKVAGLLHDIGKIGIPESILKKKGKLTDEEQQTFYDAILEDVTTIMPDEESVFWDEDGYFSFECRAENTKEIRSMYGSFLFMGISLGFVFTMAAVLIIYYKQISEGMEDKNRFAIMQQVGLSQKEVKHSIHTQILTVFFLPLITAGIHVMFAYPIIRAILRAMMLSSETVFITCTVASFLVFSVLYAVVYALTAKVYYRIISEDNK